MKRKDVEITDVVKWDEWKSPLDSQPSNIVATADCMAGKPLSLPEPARLQFIRCHDKVWRSFPTFDPIPEEAREFLEAHWQRKICLGQFNEEDPLLSKVEEELVEIKRYNFRNNVLIHVKVGSDERPASEQDVENVEKALNEALKDETGWTAMVTHHLVEIDMLSMDQTGIQPQTLGGPSVWAGETDGGTCEDPPEEQQSE